MPKFISEKAASKATPSKVIKYIMNEEKVCKDENGELVMSTIGLDNDRPYSKQFKETAELAGNDYTTSDRKYYHFKISCAPGDYSPDGEQKITPEQLKQEAEDFVHKHFEGYQAVITIQYHGEKNPFLHAHIVVNASSFDPDKNKIDLKISDLDTFRDYAYEMGKPYGLEGNYWRDEVAAKREEQRWQREQDQPEAINITKEEKKFQQTHGKNFADYSWKEQYRIAIDEAKGATTNLDSFQDYLKQHFQIDTQITSQGNIKYKFPERTTYSSGKALGGDYTLEAVEKALADTRSKPSDLPREPTEEQRQALNWVQRFDDEFHKIQKWYTEDYQNQRAECQKKDARAAEMELYRVVHENTENFYRLIREARESAALEEALADQKREYWRELDEKHQEFMKQMQLASVGWAVSRGSSYHQYEPQRIRQRQEECRQEYIKVLQTTGASLADRIVAAQNLREMNVAEGRTKDYQTQAQEVYGQDTRKHVIYAKRDWKLQAMVDSIRIADQLGANNLAELELKVKQEGREYGAIKREYNTARKQYDQAVEAAVAQLSPDSALSIKDWNQKIDEIRAAEYAKLRPIEEKYLAAKEHYKECARALETIEIANARNTMYETYEPEQTEEKKQEAPRRSKEQAEKERKEQWAELRDWADEASAAVAATPGAGKESDLKKWAAKMEKHGCQIRITSNTVSIKHPNSNQAVRSNRLGGAYEKEEISNGISLQRQANRDTARAEAGRTEQQQTNRNSRAAQGNNRAQSPGREISRDRSRQRTLER